MNTFWQRWRYLAFVIGVITGIFVFASIADIVIAALNGRFYSNAVFITLFGVAGVFASFLSYTSGIDYAPVKNAFAKWSIIIIQISIGLLIFFLLSELEGGEYRVPFKAFGVTLFICSIFFIKDKFE